MRSIIESDDYTKFISMVNEDQIQIGKRSDSRKQNELEYWVIQRYLKKAIATNGFLYRLLKRESPDFEIVIDGVAQGIEVTESSCEQYQQLLTFIDVNENLDFEIDLFRYGHVYSKDELFKLARPKGGVLGGQGWGGFEAEVFASKWARDAAIKKVKKMKKWDYKNSTRVVLYDNTPTACKNNYEFERVLRGVFGQEAELSGMNIDLLTSNGNAVIYDLCKK